MPLTLLVDSFAEFIVSVPGLSLSDLKVVPSKPLYLIALRVSEIANVPIMRLFSLRLISGLFRLDPLISNNDESAFATLELAQYSSPSFQDRHPLG